MPFSPAFSRAHIYAISLIATLGGFLFGYDTAVISGAVSSLNTFFVTPRGLSPASANMLLGFIVSGALIGCVIGSLLGGYFSQWLGRKKTLLLAAFMLLFSGVGSAAPELGFAPVGTGDHTYLAPFIFYRLLGGMGIGLASVLSPMYIAEIAPPEIRGRLVSWNQLAVVAGILIVYFVNYFIASRGDQLWNDLYGWRWMFASSAIPALLFFTLLWFVPESPRWLMIRGRERQARGILDRLVGQQMAGQEIAAIKSALSLNTAGGKLFAYGVAVIVTGVLVSMFQQLVGIQVMIYYAPEIFKNMGYANDMALFQAVLVGAVNLIFTVVAIYTIDRFGRKPLLLVGSASMALFMAVLFISFYTHQIGWAALIGVLGFVASFAMSWGPVTWVLLSEMFPNPIRSKAMAVAVAAQWITNYTVSSTFPLLDRNAFLVETFNHSVSFGIFGLMALLSFWFVWKRVPETKGRTLEEIEKIWKK